MKRTIHLLLLTLGVVCICLTTSTLSLVKPIISSSYPARAPLPRPWRATTATVLTKRGPPRIEATIGGGLIIPLLLSLKAHASPFDPHALPLFIGLCFFNGWYIRITDHDKGLAFALIIGSFKRAGASSFTEHYCALVYSDKKKKNLVMAHAFPHPDTVVMKSYSVAVAGVPSNFSWHAQGIGSLKIEDGRGEFDITLPDLSARAQIHDRVPWNQAAPDTDGPEGWLGRTPLLPCRYFVHSLGSKVTYSLRTGKNDAAAAVIRGQGYGHLETNYGNYFPDGWIWVQAVCPHRHIKLVMVGGKFQIGPTSPRTWVIGYRSPRFHWDFRTTDLDSVKSIVNYSERSLSLTAESRCGQHRLEVTIKAPEGSFGSPIYVPTQSGFSCTPGCRESFTATAVIKAYDTTSAKMVLLEEHKIELAALEFGGYHQKL